MDCIDGMMLSIRRSGLKVDAYMPSNSILSLHFSHSHQVTFLREFKDLRLQLESLI